MPLRLYAATTNRGKVREFQQMASSSSITNDVEVLLLPAEHVLPEVEETGSTFAENARIKALAYSRRLPDELVFADDSGLCVNALDDAPGVFSARYASKAVAEGSTATMGAQSTDAANNTHLLQELAKLSTNDRSAKFVCVITAARNSIVIAEAEGIAEGEILYAARGEEGFGYDPLFLYPALNKSFAEMDQTEKAQHSHRGKAFRGLLSKLQNQ